jgi:hypothetical protein
MILTNKIKIYVPSTTNVSEYIGETRFVQRWEYITELFSARYGGATVTFGKGAYTTSDDNDLVIEDVAIVEAYVGDAVEEAWQWLMEFAKMSCALWRQESVAIERDGEMMIVDAETELSGLLEDMGVAA